MHLLLLSLNVGAVPAFLGSAVGDAGRQLRLGYISDAAAHYTELPWPQLERDRLASLGYEVTEIRARELDATGFAGALDPLDAVYVAGGNTFVLLEALRSNGTGEVLTERVRSGLPYIGTSAGSVITGPSIAPIAPLDDPAEAPALASHDGLGLIAQVVVPHADGALPPYPPEVIERVVAEYGDTHPLLLLRDDQALLVIDGESRIVPSPGPAA